MLHCRVSAMACSSPPCRGERGVVYVLRGIYSRLAKVVTCLLPPLHGYGPSDAEHNASYVGSVLGAESPLPSACPYRTGESRRRRFVLVA